MKDSETRHKLKFTFLVATLVFLSAVFILALIYLLFMVVFHVNILTRIRLTSSDRRYLLGGFIAGCIILGYLISFAISRLILEPSNQLIKGMRQLAAGNFKHRLYFSMPMSKIGLLADVSNTFNKMAMELDHTETLSNDFINNFSHEFKTPIVSIAGFAKLLKKKTLPPETQQKYLSIIEEESTRLSTMAVNVLSLVKLENQTILTGVSKFNMSEQIRNSLLLLENKWAGRNYNFELDFDEYDIVANEEMLKHVWINLFDNAIKFTPDGETIKVDIKKLRESIVITVTNTGAEIPQECIHNIFNKFYKVDSSHSSEGNGIGLAVVKKIVTLHGGDVCAMSGNNKTMFIVTLPQPRSNTRESGKENKNRDLKEKANQE